MESSRRAEGLLRFRRNHIRVLVAFAVSLALHLIAIAFLTAFVFPGGASDKQWAGLTDAPFIVSIVNPGKPSQPAIPPLKQIISKQNTRNPKASSAAQDDDQNGTVSSRHMELPGFYYPAAELDAIPTIQHDIDLYPPELHSFRHGGGELVLRLWIDETGRVARAEPANSEMTGIIAEVAARAFMQAHFLPGMKNGLAVKSRVEAVLFYPPRDSSK